MCVYVLLSPVTDPLPPLSTLPSPRCHFS